MTHKPEVKKLSLDWYVQALKDKEPFTFARYNDGEWLTILGHSELKNSNGCSFTPELGQALGQAVKNQHSYQYAMCKRTRRLQGDRIVKWLANNNVTMQWYNGDLFLDESLKGNLFPLIEQIREQRVLYVGNQYLRSLNMRRAGFFPYIAYVQPPPINAYKEIDRILGEVFAAIRRYKIDFIGWSSGLAAKVFIDRVYMNYPEVTQLDFGSLFDGYFKPLPHIKERKIRNTGSRSYIRSGNYNFTELHKLNTGQE